MRWVLRIVVVERGSHEAPPCDSMRTFTTVTHKQKQSSGRSATCCVRKADVGCRECTQGKPARCSRSPPWKEWQPGAGPLWQLLMLGDGGDTSMSRMSPRFHSNPAPMTRIPDHSCSRRAGIQAVEHGYQWCEGRSLGSFAVQE